MSDGRYSPEFKAEALTLMRRIGRKPAARQLGISANTLRRWEKPDLYARQLAASADAKWRRKQLCVRGCGRLVSYDSLTGVCIDCTNADRAAKHGTRSCYSIGCRCDDCREANRVYMAECRHSGKPPTHGLSGYKNYGCRCRICTAANTTYCRAEYARRKALA